MLTGQKILLTGASGLVGLELGRALAAHNDVWGVARYLTPDQRAGTINAYAAGREEVAAAGMTPVAADLLGDLSALPDDFTYLIHTVHTRLGPDRLTDAVEINSRTTGRIMHHCRKARAALICSSTAVYASPADVWHPMKEGDPMGGAQPPFHNITSSASKISMEAVSRYCALEYGLPTIIMRLCLPYSFGGGVPTRDLLRVMRGDTLTWFGDPYPHSPIHFDDMADQIASLMDAASLSAPLVNWGGDTVMTQRQWCEIASRLSGQPLRATPLPGAPGNIVDVERRRAITGPCRTDFETAFADIYQALLRDPSPIARQIGVTQRAGPGPRIG